MIKKIFIVFTIVFLLVSNVGLTPVFASIYFGTADSNPTSVIWADSKDRDDNFKTVSVQSCSSDWSVKFHNSSKGVISTKYYDSTGLKSVPVPSGSKGFSLYSGDGKEVYAYAVTTDNPNSPEVGFQAGKCNPNPPDGGGDDGNTCSCEALKTIIKEIGNIKGVISGNTKLMQDIKVILNGHTDLMNGLKSILLDVNANLKDIEDWLELMEVDLSEIIKLLRDIKSELQTSMKPKDWDKPDFSNELDKHKPDLPNGEFKDDSLYFEDQGQDSTPDSLPTAPDPKKWDGVTEPPDPMEPDQELSQDNELSKDKELTKDKFEKDSELTKDQFTKDKELTKDKFKKDDELTKDQFKKDDELTKDQFKKDDELTKDKFEQDKELDKDKEKDQTNYFKKDKPMQQTEKEQDYLLRWKSENGVFKP